MSKFKLEKFVSKKIGKKYVFSQHEGDNWAGPSIEHYPAINTTKLGVYTEDGKYKFELKLNNTEGTDYTIRVCNKEGYPIGLTMVVSNDCLYFGKFSSREGFNGTVYRFKKDENVRIQKYSHGLLLDECIHEYVVKTNVAYPLPFECLVEAGETIERKVSNKKGDFIEFIAGNPNSRIRVLGASIDDEGGVTIGQYRDDGFSGLAMKYLPNGKTYLRTFTNGTPDGEFEFLYNSGELNGVTVSGYAIVVKKDDEAGYLDLIYYEKNGKISMQAMELTQKRKPIKESMIAFPLDVDPNAPKPTIKVPKPVTPQKDKSTGEEKLNKLIGLESVKKEIKKMKAIFHKFKTMPNKTNLNMVFYGNPGTGKTEVARIIADILYEEGLLPSNKCIEVDSSGLIGEYVGHTAIKTHDVVKNALGGVLFIDEAYMLSGGKVSGGGGFGEEAITALLKDMEDYRGQICIILAGYKEPMEKMMEINPGFTSRINRYIDFPDYSLDELRQIAILMYKNKGYEMEDKALDETIKVLSTLVNNPNFANAREVRNLLESIYEIQALRTSEDPNNMLITLADVKEYEKDHNLSFGSKPAKKKMKWNIDPEEFIYLSKQEYDYKFNNSYIEEASVNIKCFNEGKSIGEGSGFFISPKGIIGTCAHVVNGADKILVYVNIKTASGQTINKDYVADVISIDVKSDVALIGIINPEIIFPYYPLPLPQSDYPTLMSEIAMGGYPFGGDRFEKITLTEGKVQSINKDNAVGDDITKIFVDISGQPGSSGSGVINKNNGKCIGIFAGAVVHNTGTLKLTINYAVPINYLWNLIINEPVEVLESVAMLDEYKIIESMKIISNEENSYIESNKIKRRHNFEFENIHIVKGDVSTFSGDAVVNAANKYLAPGAGVCGAIFDRAGYRELQNECLQIGGCEVGNAVITNGYKLKANYIIHAVGPHYLHDEYPEKLLESVYENVFKVAIKHNIKSIALPSISTGIFRFPLEKAVPLAIKVIKKYSKKFEDIYVYCYDKDDATYNAYINELNK